MPNINLAENFYILVRDFFSIPNIKNDPYSLLGLPMNLYIFSIILVSLFSRDKITYFLLIIIFFVFFIVFISNLEFVVSFTNNSEGLLKTFKWYKIGTTTLPVLYGILFLVIPKLKIKKIMYLIYPLLLLSLINFQISPSLIPLGKYFFSFDNFNIEQQKQLRNHFHNTKYHLLIKDAIEFKKNLDENENKIFKSKYTFNGYYDYENYKYIKQMVGNSRTVSIGLDPMVAVMNNIKVLGGYYNLYPLSYKLKFRKIIEKQLDHYENFREYYDTYGQRVYTFVHDPKVIKINFVEAKLLGADYVISKYPISNQILEIICEKCEGQDIEYKIWVDELGEISKKFGDVKKQIKDFYLTSLSQAWCENCGRTFVKEKNNDETN